jgi:hypothetical protein
MERNGWKKLWRNVVSTTSAIYGVKPEHSKLKPYEIHEESVTSYILPLLTSALDGSERPVSRFCRVTPTETAPSTHWTGGRVGSRAGLDIMENKKIDPCWECNSSRPAGSPLLLQICELFEQFVNSYFAAVRVGRILRKHELAGGRR